MTKNPYMAVANVAQGFIAANEVRRRVTAFEAMQEVERKRLDSMYRLMARVGAVKTGVIQSAQPIYKQAVASGIYNEVGSSQGGIGKITDYGQQDDPDSDSLTVAGSNAIGGKITPGESVAFSRDIEAYARSKGVTIGQRVEIELSDGTVLNRIFDDRTADIYKGKKLRERIDLHTPEGASPYRDVRVLDIRPAQP